MNTVSGCKGLKPLEESRRIISTILDSLLEILHLQTLIFLLDFGLTAGHCAFVEETETRAM